MVRLSGFEPASEAYRTTIVFTTTISSICGLDYILSVLLQSLGLPCLVSALFSLVNWRIQLYNVRVFITLTSYMKKCICQICNKVYTYDRKKGHTLKKCNSCLANKRKLIVKQRCVEALGGKCSACGYSKCLQALCFHHTDPSTKNFGISGNHSRKWEIIEEELQKCILLCSNCHLELHNLLN